MFTAGPLTSMQSGPSGTFMAVNLHLTTHNPPTMGIN